MPLTLPELVPATYVDAHGTVRELDPATRADVAEVVTGAGIPRAPYVCVPGERRSDRHGELETLEGAAIGPVHGVAPDLGYYRLRTADGGSRMVISAPEHFPQPQRGWGWAVQLYAARSSE